MFLACARFFTLATFLLFIQCAFSHPANHVGQPLRIIVTGTHQPTHSSNTSHHLTSFRLQLDYARFSQQRSISPSSGSACIAATITAARRHSPNEQLPATGFKIVDRGVWLEAGAYHHDYTWGILVDTVELVEAELEARGWFSCRWNIERVGNAGSPGWLIGWGRMR
ncbi:hypothetical protein G7Y79_00080g100670 [Physcia stellaris]|nr:hypothetical protein G7Y79_00080g100670 [Physcia stellaris]